MSRTWFAAPVFAVVAAQACQPTPAGPISARAGAAAAHSRSLILYDDGGDYAWLGELYATGLGVLASHFGAWTVMPVTAYRRGAMRGYDAAIYVGFAPGQPLPADFVDDVLGGTAPVLWIGDNVRELAERAPDFVARYGFRPASFDGGPFHAVSYEGVRLARRTPDGGPGVMSYEAVDLTVARALAWAERDDGTQVPWALRTGRFTYVGENPLAYVTPGDRYLAFCDMLIGVLAPGTPERHRAVVRIEDVTPRSDPGALRTIADRLSRRGVPFSVAVVPVFQSPDGRTRMRDRPDVAGAIRYMLARGGTLVLHGYTHQHTGTTEVDIEFPLDERSEAWTEDRIARALDEMSAAGLPRAEMFEYPHYSGLPASSRAIARMIKVAFQRETFFAGTLERRPEDTTKVHRTALSVRRARRVRVAGRTGEPRPLRPRGDTTQAPQTPEDIVERARALHVVRDGVAGFFFHPVYEPATLERIVDGVVAEGYTFVSAEELAREQP